MAKKASTSATSTSTSKSRRVSKSTRRKTSASLSETAQQPEQQAALQLDQAVRPDVPTAEAALRKRALIEAVVLRTGVKKRDAKPAVEAALAILGETLVKGQGLNLPELGKVKIQNQKSVEGAHVINMRLRRKLASFEATNAESDKEGLAATAD